MTALTDPELARIRRQSGDTKAPYDLLDDDLQAIYDDTALGNGSLDTTTYYAIRDRMALAASEVDSLSDSGTGMSRSLSQKFSNLRKMLDMWGSITGLTPQPVLGTLTAGTIGLNIDSTEANILTDLENEWSG